MKNIFLRLLMIAAVSMLYPLSAWSTGTPAGFTVDLSSAQGSPVAGNALQQSMTGASINQAVVNPLTGTTTNSTSFFDLLWEFNYANNHLEIVGAGAATQPGQTGSCLIGRTVTVQDSRSGLGISGASVTIAGVTMVTNASGIAVFAANSLSVSALAGASVNIQATATNYAAGSTPVAIVCGSNGTTNISLITNQAVSTGNITIIVNWGANPRDLDSHLTGPKTTGATPRFHVYYPSRANNRSGTGTAMTTRNNTVPAFLDRDDTNGFGPETITIVRTGGSFTNGVYRYSIHHFSGSSTIQNSGAVVKVFQGSTLLATYTPPANQPTGSKYWSVFEISVTGGVPSVTAVNTYGRTFAARRVGSASGAIPVQTPLGATVYTEDPAIFQSMPIK